MLPRGLSTGRDSSIIALLGMEVKIIRVNNAILTFMQQNMATLKTAQFNYRVKGL